MKPYKQISIGKFKIRAFYKNNNSLYKWHKDQENRKVTFFPFTNFYFQLEDDLPKKIKFGQETFIFKDDFHRVTNLKKSKKSFMICFIKQW